ncbi:hypothetical protein E4T50_03167 [Aureobasidium sp. EXF-12298]|nr:hypothetical protein E4T50_03167 [Aureobasidium sp. EXF-12298]KAI4773755.1 hypothetical protein E4T52_11289 [Aureobasidium sp. EXF-3400]
MGPCSSTRLQQWYVTTCAAQCATIQQTIQPAANILCAELFHSPTTIVLAASVRSPRGRGETVQSNYRILDLNFLIMDYLINEGYPDAAMNFAKEASIVPSADGEAIQERVDIRNAIHTGDIQLAIERINELNPQILDNDSTLHFQLLRLQLIELIREIVNAPGPPSPTAFTPALEFATSQLAPRAPTSPAFLQDLERTMALLIFPSDKLTPQLKQLLDLSLRQTVASQVNEAILSSQGQRREARIRNLVRLRAWAEQRARETKSSELPEKIGLGLETQSDDYADGEAMIT